MVFLRPVWQCPSRLCRGIHVFFVRDGGCWHQCLPSVCSSRSVFGDLSLGCARTARLVPVPGLVPEQLCREIFSPWCLLIFTTIVVSAIYCTQKGLSATADSMLFRPTWCSFRINTRDPTLMASRGARTLSLKFFLSRTCSFLKMSSSFLTMWATLCFHLCSSCVALGADSTDGIGSSAMGNG